MLLFRSEEHVDRWCAVRGVDRGAAFTPEQMWRVARPWFERRLSRDWRRPTVEEAQAVFAAAGLTGRFWRLQPAPEPR